MGSPITFSGFNNIDFSMILNAVMTQNSAPLTALQKRQDGVKAQRTSFDKLRSEVQTLQGAADDLKKLTAGDTVAVSTTDATAVTVTAGSNAVAGHVDVVVTELARAQVTAAASTSADANTTIVASGGTLTIGGVAVTVAGDVTLQGLATAINGTADIPVTASVVRAGEGAYRLVLTGRETGAAAAYTVVNALTGSTVNFTDTDNDGITGDNAADNAVTATDASILVNNVLATSATNTFVDAVPGLTLTVLKKDPAATIGVAVTADSTELKTRLDAFIKAYNAITKFATDQRNSAIKGEAGSLGRAPLMRELTQQLRTAVGAPYGAGALTRLSELGVDIASGGTLSLDLKVFDDVFSADKSGVVDLVRGATGAFGELDTLLKRFTDSDGFLNTNQTQLDRQIRSLDGQMANMQFRLSVQRSALQKEFLAAEMAMSRLQSQAGALAGFGA